MSYLLNFIIVIYQRIISPLLPPTCRYTPTCSEYAKEAIRWVLASSSIAYPLFIELLIKAHMRTMPVMNTNCLRGAAKISWKSWTKDG